MLVRMYEMLCGQTPFATQNVEGIFQRIHTEEVSFGTVFNGMPDAVDLIKRLCQREPRMRLGAR